MQAWDSHQSWWLPGRWLSWKWAPFVSTLVHLVLGVICGVLFHIPAYVRGDLLMAPGLITTFVVVSYVPAGLIKAHLELSKASFNDGLAISADEASPFAKGRAAQLIAQATAPTTAQALVMASAQGQPPLQATPAAQPQQVRPELFLRE